MPPAHHPRASSRAGTTAARGAVPARAAQVMVMAVARCSAGARRTRARPEEAAATTTTTTTSPRAVPPPPSPAPSSSRAAAAPTPAAAAAAAAALALSWGCCWAPPALAIVPPPVVPPPPAAALAAAPAATAAAMAWFGGGNGAAAPAPAPTLLGGPVPRAERPPVSEIVDEEVANPPDLADFLELQTSGRAAKMSASALEAQRAKVGFSRAPTGRVTLLATGGAMGAEAARDAERFEVRCDMGAPGYLLLRDESGGCWYLPPDPSGELAQIDLSDDAVVAQLFASHVWEDLIEPLDVAADAGGEQLRQLRLSEGEFRAVLSLVRGATPEPAERLDASMERK